MKGRPGPLPLPAGEARERGLPEAARGDLRLGELPVAGLQRRGQGSRGETEEGLLVLSCRRFRGALECRVVGVWGVGV